ncbi:TolC family outer membrane protein [Bartonella ancashensis]|uniref:Type I secretion outer membrane protein, TolC n=1 Tax=Bartonella ancashensis TaxID=1318743 RepID=A0A0M3T2Y7_9HYPH|nr:TolC family outer membrane protein [Bartonella ancashensis]ALE03661.1 Type I secretion outer membrane protein, TolC precursor [Bartonella ancashensis]
MFKISKKFQIYPFFVLGILVSSSVYADTLEDALAKAYVHNIKLNNERVAMRISSDDVAIARAGFFPQIDGFGSYNRGNNVGGSYSNSGSIGIRVNQRLFDGFVTQNLFLSAQIKLKAQREYLRNAEQNLFLDVVTAYTNVYQARRVAELRKENLASLEELVNSTKAKLDVGEAAGVDFAQAQAAYAVAVSEFSLARSEVKSAEAVYQQVVGTEAADLEPPSGAKELPKSLDVGYRDSIATHPTVLYAKYLADASLYSVKAQEGALLPKIDFSATTSYNRTYTSPELDHTSHSVGISLNVPIFEGGRTSAQIRQSKARFEQASLQLELAKSNIKQAITSAWFQLESARASAEAYRKSVHAAEIAFKGRIQENYVGQATLLDVLNSRTHLIGAQISLANAEKNVVIAGYNLQSFVGKLTASYLGLENTQPAQ